MILDYDTGFSPELSLYALLKKHKKINGAGAYLYIGDHSDHKFSQKNILKELKDPEFAKIFMDASFEVLETLISSGTTNTNIEEQDDTVVDITSMMPK